MPKISLICNFYNSEKFIPALIESVLQQDFEDWELIAVNDCSPGKDLKVLERFKDDPRMKDRMKIIDNTVNLGISKAKYVGWKAAQGDFVMFSDGDDTLEPETFRRSYEAALNYKADIVVMDVYRVYKLPFYIKKTLSKSSVQYNTVYNREAIRDELMHSFYGINLLSGVGYWGKLFRRSLLEKSEYEVPKHGFAEDLLFNLEAFRKADRIVFIDYPCYNWFWGGLTSGSNSKRLNEGKEQAYYSARSIISRYEDLYDYRIKRLESDNFPPILRKFLIIELKNVFLAQFTQYAVYNGDKQQSYEVKQLMKSILEHPTFNFSKNIMEEWPELNNSKGMKEIIDQNVEALYNMTHDIYKKKWKSRIIKRVLSIFH